MKGIGRNKLDFLDLLDLADKPRGASSILPFFLTYNYSLNQPLYPSAIGIFAIKGHKCGHKVN